MSISDVIGGLAGLDAEQSERLRGHRPEAVAAAEQSLRALFDAPAHDEAPDLSRVVRLLTAARAASVDGSAAVAEFYAEQLGEEPDAPDLSTELALRMLVDGADGESAPGASRKIRSLLRHIDLLVQRPAAATSDDLDALASSGWSTTEIVVLSQIVTFVAYQTRVVHGLRVLSEAGA